MNDDVRREYNIAHALPEVAVAHPWKRAVVCTVSGGRRGRRAGYAHLTFAQLDALSNRYAWGLSGHGMGRGMRVLLMVRPGLDFFALTFALFKMGAVPVLIDPGMGWRSFMRCVAQVEPTGFIGVPAAHVLRALFPHRFRSVRHAVTLGPRLFRHAPSLRALATDGGIYPVTAVSVDETAAILFTTGSTGPAKGVVYTHRIFRTQTEMLRREFGIGSDDIDLPCFPLFALFSTALGVTAIVPDMNPSHPARVDPRQLVRAIEDHGVTYSFGSPALWDRVGKHCAEHGIGLPSLTRVIMAGAPVPGRLHAQLLDNVLPPGAQTYTPYGATEALPVSNFTGTEMLANTDAMTRTGAGMCVGRPIPEARVRIIGITDAPIARWDDRLELAPGEIGEIVVKGPVVTRCYHNLPEATQGAKIADAAEVWHRMGDIGYFDEHGRLWFCGRKGHRVTTAAGTLYTVRCEAIFNEHPRVFRSALVGVGRDRAKQTPVIVIEPEKGCFPRHAKARRAFAEELLRLGGESPLTRNIRHVLFHRAFPVDIRHNAKIRREALALWAAARVPL